MERTPQAPLFKTAIPGPKARRILERDKRTISPSYTRSYPLVAHRGWGCTIEDPDGNLFLDFTAGIAVTATGHCHPEVVKAIQDQAARLLHMSGTDFYYKVQSDLAVELGKIAPIRGKHPMIFFGNSGAEAVEAAIKLARYHTGRPRLIAFQGAFHGRTLGALSLTNSRTVQRRGFTPLMEGVSHIPFPYCYRCPINLEFPGCEIRCLEALTETLFKRSVSPDDVAAIVIEPVQGEGGYIFPPAEYLRRLREVADKHGILIVADEVQSGMGRTGKFFASEHFPGFEPDIITSAKGIASGMPISAMIADRKVMDWPPGAHASTFGGNPVSCAAALTTLKLLRGGLLDHVNVVGEHLIGRLKTLQRRHGDIGDVRGRGLMVGVELVKDKRTQGKDPARVERVLQECFRRGLLLLSCGESAVRFCPPLVVTEKEIDRGLAIFGAALKATK